MKHETYQCLRKAYLGSVDPSALHRAMDDEPDPFVTRVLKLASNPVSMFMPSWDSQNFTTQFRNASPKERMDETVITFILRFVAVIKNDFHFRMFLKPESQAAMQAWICLLKQSIFAILTLLYRAQWSPNDYFKLDRLVMDLVYDGKYGALRDFMVDDLHLDVTDAITQAEKNFDKLIFLNIVQFGSSFWRLLHWMAEAIDFRETQLAKTLWRDLVTRSLYRVLKCGICMAHMRKIVQELEPQLLSETTQYSQLWYNIHNRVNSVKLDRSLEATLYSESEFELDASFMRQAL